LTEYIGDLLKNPAFRKGIERIFGRAVATEGKK